MSTDTNVIIQPAQEVTTVTVASFKINVMSLELFKGAHLSIALFNSEMNVIGIKYIDIMGEDYEQWNNDDNYVINFVANKLGFVIQN